MLDRLGLLAACAALLAVAVGAHHEGAKPGHRTPAPEGARVYIISPADGAEIRGPVTVRFGLVGMGVAPAGYPGAGTGHHHLLIDTDLPALDASIPDDARHRHFGKGQTEVTLDLSPGEHTLQLLLGDQNHVPHDPPLVSERIRITVK